MIEAEKNTATFKKTHAAGRVDKFLIDLGWGRNLLCFVIYGCSGNSKEAKECTEAIVDAIEQEIGDDYAMPILTEGDFNNTPSEI